MRLLVHPDTCAVLRLETGTDVGKTETKSTILEWSSDARYQRYDQRSPRVTRLSGLDSAEQALQVREDELLASGFVQLEQRDMAEVLAHHDPWKTWRRAQRSDSALTELWKGLVPHERLHRASRGVSVTAVRAEHVELKTPLGRLTCHLPLDPQELGEAPSFLIPLLVRHSSMGDGRRAGLLWDPVEGLVLGCGDVEFQYSEDDGTLVRTDADADAEAVVPATVATIMEFVLERFVGER